ncbi:3-phosphoshikimate 1-carboxyvinyltransferase [Pseudoclavibacter chungangensis]|uniref:3-phosphoshikimate 1-carboxyvinyltransferase n=1 Tax=Pseudoclavibacter chungangensis TaxID=587635 RepID=A0A7J5BRJ2_9MICO|nr:3-phosphoshikimate 1-carboxyvinyltransferase [Pseudoclavibacter chungangensis]KAB1655067.1 3-phosphoshikimate 1-carboxyvinyltransferase [Pseudoclavibacter chungangensis]NYJ66170.1 3-phosphoshikimate 1-carboxyvinyltransferase [Pseudoclavibacter chungangensis]
MEIFDYSGPRFDVYREDAASEPLVLDDGPWPAPRADGPVEARLRIPGSKSRTNRELVLSALAREASILRRPLHARDTDLMVTALTQLGTTSDHLDEGGRFGDDLEIVPGTLTGGVSIDCGLAGTVMRFVPPLAALALGPVAFDGDESARRRPMGTTVEALTALGVDVRDDHRGRLPFSLYGTGRVQGGKVRIDASASSQFVSGLLLSAPRFRRGLTVRHTGEHLPSVPHIDMTLEALQGRGVAAERVDERTWHVPASPIAGAEITIEPDLSNAEPFLVAAIVAGGSVSIEDWPERTTQVGAQLVPILERFGATFERTDDGALVCSVERGIVEGHEVRGIDLDLGEAGELAPNLAALCALCSTPSRLTGIGHLRGHETDRLAALATELTKVGAEVTEFDDGLEIVPGELHGAEWSAYEDHRMATSGAIVGLAVDGVTIDDIGSTGKTLPQFPELWAELLRPGGEEPDEPGTISLADFGV